MQISKINDLIGETIPCNDLSSRNVPALSAKCPGAFYLKATSIASRQEVIQLIMTPAPALYEDFNIG
nr:hypothetical protein [Tanacetum cinerariifolium]